MASKFNVNIQGGSGSIVMGDNTNVNITSRQNNSERPTVTIARGAQKRSPFQPNLGVHVQETNLYKPTEQITHKITQGFALIIHNQEFDKMDYRTGSENDVTAIKAFCDLTGITVHNTSKSENLTATEIEELCSEISERDFSRYDGFLCFILSHGKEEVIFGVDGNEVSVQKIVSSFRGKPTLNGTPKLFFIQACRGNKSDYGVESDSYKVNQLSRMHLPTDADFLVAYSTVEGNESYRSCEEGTWFIKKLMAIFNWHGHNMHLMDMLTHVNHQIASLKTPDGRKQMPSQMTTLTKFVYFGIPSPRT